MRAREHVRHKNRESRSQAGIHGQEGRRRTNHATRELRRHRSRWKTGRV